MRTIERITRANEISSRLAGPRFDGDEAPLVVVHLLAQRAILEKHITKPVDRADDGRDFASNA
jgi:hypothetical protein